MADTLKIATKTIFALRDRSGAIAEAAALLKSGGICVIPTETVYGLAADAFNAAAVNSIFKAKGRPNDNPLIVHISDMEMLSLVAESTAQAQALMRAFWPGPLSLVLRRMPGVPDEVTAGLETVAVRMPQNDIARDIIAAAGPLAAPSANISGRPSPTTAAHAFEDLCGRVPLVIDGGPCQTGVESTVVDARGEIPVILRPGGVTPEMIERLCGGVAFAGGALAGETPPSPGMKYRHYAPAARVSLLCGSKKEVAKNINTMYYNYSESGEKPVVFCAEDCAKLYAGLHIVSLGTGAEDAQARLFAAMRGADSEGFSHILFHYTEDMGLAVKNRVEKAAGAGAEPVGAKQL